MRSQVIFTRIPKTVQKIIESANTESIAEFNTAEDSIKRVDFQLRGSLSQGSDFKIQRQQVGTVHAGRSPWLRSKDRVCAFKFFIGVGKVKIPKAVNDIPSRVGDGIRIRIMFT